MPYLFALILLLAPLYVWRFSIGGLPTNFLMLANFVVIGVGLVLMFRNGVNAVIQKHKQKVFGLSRPLLIGIIIVKVASIISLFAFGLTPEKFAQWLVLYAQPLTFFYLIIFFKDDNEKVLEYFKTAAYVIVGVAGALAVIQYFTLYTLPQEWWGNANEPKRAIAFFAHANAFGLFVTPLLAWLIPDLVKKIQDNAKHWLWYVAGGALGGIGIMLSLSRGAWLGLVVAIGAYVILSANKKMLIGFVIAGLLVSGVVAAIPNLRYRVILPFYGEKSAVARLSLWGTAKEMISDNPILGKGIEGFSNNWDAYNKDTGLEHYNFPHNFLLNFWIDLGLLGVIGFGIIFIHTIWEGIKNRRKQLALGAALFVLAMLAHGLIDIPYLKNDLALLFWMMLAVSIQIPNMKKNS